MENRSEQVQAPRGGRLTADERDPNLLCAGINRETGKRCGNYALKHQTVCRFHGGDAEASAELVETHVAQIATINQAAAAGLDITAIEPKDLPKLAAQLAAYHTTQLAAVHRLLVEHDALSTVEGLREYDDVIDRADRTSAAVTRAIAAAHTLAGPQDPEDDLDGLTGYAKLEALMDDLEQRRDATHDRCKSCDGSGYVPRLTVTN